MSSKDGMYCGEVSEMSQPLLPIGMKTPMSMPFSEAAAPPIPARKRRAADHLALALRAWQS